MGESLAVCFAGPYKALPAMSGFPSGADRVATLPPSPSSEATDATTELLQGCIRGDVDARRRLVTEYSGIVSYGVSVIFQQFGRPSRKEEIEDICQDVFLALFDQDARKLRQYQGRNGCSLASWLRVLTSVMRPARTSEMK